MADSEAKVRTYVIENPSSPREPETEKFVWLMKSNGVKRTVKHDGPRNIVTWDFTNDKWS